jgi:hypothetical protein
MNSLFIVILLFGVICGTSAQTKIPSVAGITTFVHDGKQHYVYSSFVKETNEQYSNNKLYFIWPTDLEVISNNDGKFRFRTLPLHSDKVRVVTPPLHTDISDQYEFELSGDFGPKHGELIPDQELLFTLLDTQEARQQYVDVDTVMSQRVQKGLDRHVNCANTYFRSTGRDNVKFLPKSVAIKIDDTPEVFTDMTSDQYEAIMLYEGNGLKWLLVTMTLRNYAINNEGVVNKDLEDKMFSVDLPFMRPFIC